MARKRKGEGQTALITGASMGIGVDLAECFAKDGYDVILKARSEPQLDDWPVERIIRNREAHHAAWRAARPGLWSLGQAGE